VRGDRDVDRTLAKEIVIVVAGLRRHVRVTIDEARQHGRRAEVDDARIARHGESSTDGGDAASIDENHRVRDRRAPLAVDEPSGTNREPSRGAGGVGGLLSTKRLIQRHGDDRSGEQKSPADTEKRRHVSPGW
jgi:hypothetical protein